MYSFVAVVFVLSHCASSRLRHLCRSGDWCSLVCFGALCTTAETVSIAAAVAVKVLRSRYERSATHNVVYIKRDIAGEIF